MLQLTETHIIWPYTVLNVIKVNIVVNSYVLGRPIHTVFSPNQELFDYLIYFINFIVAKKNF